MYLRLFVSIIILLSTNGCKKQHQPTFKDKLGSHAILSMAFYDVDPMRPEYANCNLSTIFSVSSYDELLGLINKAHLASSLEKPLWKGSHLCVVRLDDNTEIKLAVSVYGSFFKILGEDAVYVFSDNSSASIEWNRLLRQINNTFIDKRILNERASSEK